MNSKTIKINGKSLRCRKIKRGFVRSTDILEGSAGCALATSKYNMYRIGWHGVIAHLKVWRPIPKPKAKPKSKFWESFTLEPVVPQNGYAWSCQIKGKRYILWYTFRVLMRDVTSQTEHAGQKWQSIIPATISMRTK